MKGISTIKPAITENTECTIVKAHAPVIDTKWVCHLNTVYHFASSSSNDVWLIFQAEEVGSVHVSFQEPLK